MKPEWERTTRVCPSHELQPDLREALRAHADAKELGAVEAKALVCFETVSRRARKPSLLMRMAGAGHKEMAQAVLVTPTRLVWAQRAADAGASAHSQLLARLDVSDYEDGPGFQVLPDHGVEVHGIEAMGGHIGTLFFGLGEGPDADHARHVLKEAVRTAHGEGPDPNGDPAGTD